MIGSGTIGSGGFGCVFSPALKCKGMERKKGHISKLIDKKKAYDEFSEIKKIQELVRDLPDNSKKYFLIDDVSMCKYLEPLTDNDMKNIDKCDKLFDKNKINDELNNYHSIDMKYGGDTFSYCVSNYVKNKNYKELALITRELYNLLNNAVIIMNKHGVYHGDIKSNNILYDGLNLKLIDWGLSGKQEEIETGWINKTKQMQIDDILLRRPIQFNLPLSSPIFINYNKFKHNSIKINSNNQGTEDVNLFLNVYNYVTNNKKTNGHIRFILQNAHKLYKLKEIFSGYKNQYVENVKEYFKDRYFDSNEKIVSIMNSMGDSADKYSVLIAINLYESCRVYTDNNNKFDYIYYFNYVYSKNLDVHGLLSCLLDYDIESINVEEISRFMVDFMLDTYLNCLYSVEPYDINIINAGLSKLSNLFDNYDMQNKKTLASDSSNPVTTNFQSDKSSLDSLSKRIRPKTESTDHLSHESRTDISHKSTEPPYDDKSYHIDSGKGEPLSLGINSQQSFIYENSITTPNYTTNPNKMTTDLMHITDDNIISGVMTPTSSTLSQLERFINNERNEPTNYIQQKTTKTNNISESSLVPENNLILFGTSSDSTYSELGHLYKSRSTGNSENGTSSLFPAPSIKIPSDNTQKSNEKIFSSPRTGPPISKQPIRVDNLVDTKKSSLSSIVAPVKLSDGNDDMLASIKSTALDIARLSSPNVSQPIPVMNKLINHDRNFNTYKSKTASKSKRTLKSKKSPKNKTKKVSKKITYLSTIKPLLPSNSDNKLNNLFDLENTNESSNLGISLKGKKRCPNGYKKNKNGRCYKTKPKNKTKKYQKKIMLSENELLKDLFGDAVPSSDVMLKKGSRCKKGYKYSRPDGKCRKNKTKKLKY